MIEEYERKGMKEDEKSKDAMKAGLLFYFKRYEEALPSGTVSIGRNVHLAVFCNVAGGSEGIIFDDFSGFAYGVHAFSQSDDYSGRTLTNPTVPAKYKSEIKKAVRIGRHCIVGTNSMIFPGVVLAEGTSVGALSMVTKSTEEWSVYSGVPAKKIKDRRRDLLALEKEYLSDVGK